MKTMTKLALGAVMACGIAVAATAPAEAGVRVGFGFGVPVVAPMVAPVYPATCYDYYGQPYYCGYGQNVGIGFGGYWGGHDRDGHRFDRGHFDHGGDRGGHGRHI